MKVAVANDGVAGSGIHTEQRIAWLTLAIGVVSASVAGALDARKWAAGLLIGAALAWLNFRWMRRGADAVVLAGRAQAGAANPQPPSGMAWAALRYALIGLCIYVIFEFLKVPLASMLVGLCALGVAAIAASVWEVVRDS